MKRIVALSLKRGRSFYRWTSWRYLGLGVEQHAVMKGKGGRAGPSQRLEVADVVSILEFGDSYTTNPQ